MLIHCTFYYRPTRAFYFVYDQHQICSMYGPILMLHFSYLCSGPSSLQKIRKNHVATTQNNNSLGNKFSKVALISQALNDNKTCPIFFIRYTGNSKRDLIRFHSSVNTGRSVSTVHIKVHYIRHLMQKIMRNVELYCEHF